MAEADHGYIGEPVLRVEDDRLLRGFGRFLDDVPEPPETLHLSFVRSSVAHGLIRSIDTQAAASVPGVVAVVTAADIGNDIKPMRADYDRPGFEPTDWPVIAADRVRYVGEIVAVVLAENPYAAEDAVDLVQVDYESLRAVTTVEEALAPEAPLVHEEIGTNVYFHNAFKTEGFDEVFAAADHFFSEEFHNNRIAAVSLEPRGFVVDYDRGDDALTVWASTQMPHLHRDCLAEHLGIDDTRVRVIAPDVGGGFGMKAYVYPEDLLGAALARRYKLPTKWVPDRRDDFLTSVHCRDHLFNLELAMSAEGIIQAIRVRIRVNSGAYVSYPMGSAIEAAGGALMLPGPYKLAFYAFETCAVSTNVCPTGAFRGIAAPSAFFATEGLMDRAALALGLDPVQIRMRNLLKPEEFPYTNAMGIRYDTGTYRDQLQRAIELIDYHEYRRNQPPSRKADGAYHGIGIACIVEHTGQGAARYRQRGMLRLPGFEGAHVKIERSGKAFAYVSQATQGQGHLTAFAQIAAEQLGISLENVTVVEGDSNATPYGMGTGASRGAVVAGGAVLRAAGEVRSKILRIAGQILEVHPNDLELDDGHVHVRGVPQVKVAIEEIAAVAHSVDDRAMPDGETYGLEAIEYYDPSFTSIASAVHAACVAVDAATGLVKVERYVVVHDCGRVINPIIVDGQIHGAVGQGLGQALMEAVRYDREGQLLTAQLLDYVLPTSADVPDMVIDSIETPSLDSEGGFKGVGESGNIASLPAIANAVSDALLPLGANVNRLPLKPDYVLDLIEADREAL